MKFTLLATLLLALCPLACADEPGNRIVLDIPWSPVATRNGEGAFVTLKTGRVVLYYNQFSGGSSDFDRNAIMEVHSDDEGVTWSKPRVAITPPEGNSRPLPSETIRRLAAMTSAGRIRDARSEGWASALAASRTVSWTPAAAELSFQRRRVDGRDLYFVVNLGDDFEGEVSFPQTGGLWEVWDADHGSIRPAAQLSARGGRTHLRLSLRHAESTWISSSAGDQGPPVQVVRASGGSFHYSETGLLLGCFDRAGQHEVTLSNGESRSIDVSIPAPVLLDGPWSLSVRSEQALSPQRPVTLRLERLVSWRQLAELRRYAGSATYTTEFDLPEKMCRPDVAVVLDLGEVYELANVEVNGHAVGTVWCGPFSIEVTDAVRPGRNQLRLEVPNQMKNSLERSDGFARALGGDGKRSPEPDATADFYTRPSGLLGPVVLRAAGRVVIAPANLLERN
jgi:hypothetical protein